MSRRLTYLALLIVPTVLVGAAAVLVTRAGDEPTSAQRYEANTTVLESEQHGPELCLSGVAESYPPQCGGVPVVGWDWAEVDGEESASGTTWVEARVVGTYDDDRFTLTEAPGPIRREDLSDEEAYLRPACEEPQATNDDDMAEWDESVRVAELPDLVALWVNDPSGPKWDGPFVANLFVRPGDAERVEAAVREQWGGHLCIVERDQPLEKELHRMKERLVDVLGDELMYAGAATRDGVVEVTVVAVTDEVRAKVREAVDEDLVELTGALKPIE